MTENGHPTQPQGNEPDSLVKILESTNIWNKAALGDPDALLALGDGRYEAVLRKEFRVPRYIHTKSGEHYTIVCAATRELDSVPITVYRSEQQPFKIWARPTQEFLQKFQLIE